MPIDFHFLNLLLKILIQLLRQIFGYFKTKRLTVQQKYCKYLSGRIYRYWSCSDFSKLRVCMGFCREEHFTVPPSLLCSKDTAMTTEEPLSLCEVDSIHPLQGSDGYSVLSDLFLCSLFQGTRPLALSVSTASRSPPALCSAPRHGELPEVFSLHSSVEHWQLCQ